MNELIELPRSRSRSVLGRVQFQVCWLFAVEVGVSYEPEWK